MRCSNAWLAIVQKAQLGGVHTQGMAAMSAHPAPARVRVRARARALRDRGSELSARGRRTATASAPAGMSMIFPAQAGVARQRLLRLQEHQEVIDEIRGLIDNVLAVPGQ